MYFDIDSHIWHSGISIGQKYPNRDGASGGYPI